MPEFFNVLPPQQALEALLERLPASALMPSETVDIEQALGRITAGEICSAQALPAFPRSTVDGFSLRAADTYGASQGLPAYFDLVGEVPMGQAAQVSVGVGQAAATYTGGMLAGNADAVVMVEDTQQVDAGPVAQAPLGARRQDPSEPPAVETSSLAAGGDAMKGWAGSTMAGWAGSTMAGWAGSTIEVSRPVAPGENVVQVGEDVQPGELVLPSGHCLRPQDLGGLTALGITRVKVARQPRVAILSMGDEVVPPQQEPAPGQIRDVNTYTIGALVRQSGGIPIPLGIVGDDYRQQLDAAREGLQQADVLVFSAGSSVSIRDLTADIINALGGPGVLVHGLSIRPGKPAIVGLVGGKAAFGLPGNPVSAMIVFDLLVRPLLYHLAGCSVIPQPATSPARLTRNIASAPGREDYVPVRLGRNSDGTPTADPVFGKSNLIYTLIRADGLVKVPLDDAGLYAGETVTVRLF